MGTVQLQMDSGGAERSYMTDPKHDQTEFS